MTFYVRKTRRTFPGGSVREPQRTSARQWITILASVLMPLPSLLFNTSLGQTLAGCFQRLLILSSGNSLASGCVCWREQSSKGEVCQKESLIISSGIVGEAETRGAAGTDNGKGLQRVRPLLSQAAAA